MFCPNCGNASQQASSYCRQCGEFLPDYSKKRNQLAFGGETPQQQIRTNLVLNLLSSIVSIASAIVLFTVPKTVGAAQIIYLIAALLLAVGGWQLSTFFVGLKLRKHFNQRKGASNVEETPPVEENAMPKTISSFETARMKILLDEANLDDAIPASVVENTTRKLKEKVPLAQTEK